ncbi:ABC-2 type transport system ATP-binding protein [Trueperella bonasi]|uniref:ABC-2 type transport system ATP-binding protein n=1 Tax=Trueperella bonasi TaxID=312286 RepID=A0ABT9NFF5_9ACTO|nr:ABC transporter ATP-binding protein [Trueperella bonasi]MDP9806107.1 ABC-2 type transport system ATP-binding protein [Trueperella bonasi]
MNTIYQPYTVEMTNVGYKYGRTPAVVDVTATIEAGKITGLLGRNGSGKTTLEMMIAGQLKATGTVRVGGQAVWENPRIMPGVALVSESPAVYEDSALANTISLWEHVRPTFQRDVVERLLDAWEINPKKAPEKLSRGQKSAFYAALGIGSRAPLTIFDEVHVGMDAVLRRDFYDVLLHDFIAYPRTIIISSHNVDEIENLIENVIILDGGRVVEAGSADDVRAAYSGPDRLASLTDVLAAINTRRTGLEALGESESGQQDQAAQQDQVAQQDQAEFSDEEARQ